MISNYIKISLVLVFLGFIISCKAPELALQQVDKSVPESFKKHPTDSFNIASINWRSYFQDQELNMLIDSALKNNQELNMVFQELIINRNEVLEKSGEYRPFVNLGGGTGLERPGKYTPAGAVEEQLEVRPDRQFPDPLGDFQLGVTASWEVDIYRKLRNAQSAAEFRLLANTEGKNYLITQLIAEIAASYYELMAMDNLLEIINQNLTLQENALEKALVLKQNAKANQLAVNRFQAQLLNTKNQQYAIRQKIVQTENKLRYLVGGYPDKISRNTNKLMELAVDSLQAGIPAQLLANRPDILEAEYRIAAAELDIKSARAAFFPRLEIKSGMGFQAFSPRFLLNPASIIMNIAGDLVAPFINKNAIQARYNTANAQQLQAVFHYEQTLLNAYTDVLNQLAKLENYSNSLDTKAKEVKVLKESVTIANSLFKYAKADYVEVLLTQEEVLDAQMELVEAKLGQLEAKVGIYRALGGGW